MPIPTRRAMLLSLLATPALAQAPRQITFGLVLPDDPERLRPRWAAFLADLGAGSKIDVQAFYAPDEAALIHATRTGAVQLAWLTNTGAIEAVDSAAAEVFARRTFPDTSTGVRSLLLVNKSSPFQSMEDVIAAPAGTLSYRT